MPTQVKWKAISVLVALVVGCYMLLPTVLQVADQKAEFETAGVPVPWYFHLLPDKSLRLGLDLQGGIYVELEVALEEAVRRKTDILANEVRREMERENSSLDTISQTEPGVFDLTFPSPEAYSTFEQIHNRFYRRTFVVRGVDNATIRPVAHIALTDEYRSTLVNDVIEQATESVRNRINRYGVGEPDIRRQGKDRIAIELPGLKDPDRALSIIKRTGQLEFRMVDKVDNPTALNAQQADLQVKIAQVREANGLLADDWTVETTARINELLKDQLPPNTQLFFQLIRDPKTQEVIRGLPYLVEDKASITGDMLTEARVTVERNEPKVFFRLNKMGGKIFADLTRNNVNHFFAIILDDTVMSAPSIREPILQASGVIEMGVGDFDTLQREARDLALILQEGALPASLSEATKTVVGPTLGAELIRQGFRATLLAALGVILFMLIFYRVAGVVADLALGLNVLLLLAILTLFNATLTLPGIAGIVLTIGMAVDANVIINERIKEELRSGKRMKQAVQEGYMHAKRAILDANLTTLIAGIVLYQFGTGAIKGFAVTLCVGIVTTLFTTIIGTRVGYDLLYARPKPRVAA